MSRIAPEAPLMPETDMLPPQAYFEQSGAPSTTVFLGRPPNKQP